MDVSTEIHFHHVQTTLVSEFVLLANTASKCKERLLCRPSQRPVPPAAAAHEMCLSLWFWNSRRKLQGRQLSLESLSPLGSQQLLLWSVKWMWASPQLMVALKQLEAQLYCAVLQLLGTTEHDGSVPLWLHICSPTANTLNVKQTQHAPAEAFRGVCFPASCSFCSGYWVVTENCLISTIFFYSILGEKHISSKKFSWKPKLALLKEGLDLGSCLPCLKQTLVTELLAISKTDALLYLCFPTHTHTSIWYLVLEPERRL